jgi:hypothetical protein
LHCRGGAKKFRRNTEEGERLEEGLFLVSRSIEE